jgi:hypothetical protein
MKPVASSTPWVSVGPIDWPADVVTHTSGFASGPIVMPVSPGGPEVPSLHARGRGQREHVGLGLLTRERLDRNLL